MTELALDDVQGHALSSELDGKEDQDPMAGELIAEWLLAGE